MKRFSRIITLMLALAMLFALCTASASAATEETVRQFGELDENGNGGFLVFGDSFSRGTGATEDYEERGEYANFNCRNVTGSYPYLVAEAVGCNTPAKMDDQTGNYWPCCYPGQTLAATMDLIGIEDDFYDSEYAHNFDIYSRYDLLMLQYFRCPESVDGDGGTGKTGNIREIIKKAGLICVELGMGDVFYRPFHIIDKSGMLSDESVPAAERYSKAVAILLEEVNEGFIYWSENYPKFISALQEINPDAEIVVIGGFNPLDGVEIADDLLLPVGSTFSAMTGMMNRLYAKWAKELGVTYVDISNTETYSTQYDWSLLGDIMANIELATHPTPESYSYIARQILSVLPDDAGETEPVTNNIKIDLGHYTNVSYVMVDGRKVTDYSMDGYVLTIPCECKYAKNVTVAIINSDRTLDVVSYQLSYHPDTGYTPYRILGKNDVVGAAAKTAKAAVSLAANVTKSVLSKLFK